MGERGRRIRGLLGLGGRRVLGRVGGAGPRVVLAVLGVAIAVGFAVTVAGVSLGLASASTVHGDAVEYWIVPESGSVSSAVVSSSGPQLSEVHAVTTRIESDRRVAWATPVLMEIVRVSNPDPETGTSEYVLAVGVIPPPDGSAIAGVSTAPLEPGDPHYANGTYGGTWTGEVVLNEAAANLLNASAGTTLRTSGGNATIRTFTVAAVSDGDGATGVGPAPVALIHLSELQAVTGATAADGADQLLVSTDSPGVRAHLASVYPRTIVLASDGLSARGLSTSQLPLAIAVSAFVTSLLVGALFVATTMGLEIAADRSQLATLAAIGYSRRSRALLVLAETLSIALLGGVVGVALGGLGIVAANSLGETTLGVTRVAAFHPALIAYGVGGALLIGLVAAPYPLAVSWRTDILEGLEE